MYRNTYLKNKTLLFILKKYLKVYSLILQVHKLYQRIITENVCNVNIENLLNSINSILLFDFKAPYIIIMSYQQKDKVVRA